MRILKGTSARVLAAGLIVALLGMLKDILVARRFGISASADVYALGYGLATAVGAAVSSAALLIVVPTIARSLAAGRGNSLRSVVLAERRTILWGIGASLGIACIAIVRPQILFLRELDPRTVHDLRNMMLAVSVLPAGMVLATILGSIIRFEGAHGLATLAPGWRSLGATTALVVASGSIGIVAAGIGLSVGLLIEVAMLLALGSRRFRQSARWSSEGQGARGEFRSAPFWTAIVVPMLPLVSFLTDKVVISGASIGGPATLEFSYKLVSLPHSLVAMGLVSVSFVEISRYWQATGHGEASQRFASTMLGIAYAMSVVGVFLMVMAKPLVSMIYGSPQAGTGATSEVARCLVWYAMGLVPMGWGALSARVAFLAGEARKAAGLAILIAALNGLLDVAVARSFGAPGIALVTSVMAGLWCFALLSLPACRALLLATTTKVRSEIASGFVWIASATVVCIVVRVLLQSLVADDSWAGNAITVAGCALVMAPFVIYKASSWPGQQAVTKQAGSHPSRIVFVSEGDCSQASADHRVFGLARELSAHGHEIKVFCGKKRTFGKSTVWVVGPVVLWRAWRSITPGCVLVIHRTAHIGVLAMCVFARVFRDARIVFDFDDAIHLPWKAGLPHPLYYALRGILMVSHQAWCGSTFLQRFARRYTDARRIPTAVAPEFYRDRIGGAALPTIVWFGNGPANRRSLLLLVAPLRRLARVSRFRFVILSALGDQAIIDAFQQMAKDVEVDFGWPEWRPVGDVADVVRRCDIAVMPLEATPWNEGKCSMKALEAMANGLPVVLSAVGENVVVAGDSEYALLAKDERDWYRHLRALLCVEDLRRVYGLRGQRRVGMGYSLAVVTQQVTRALQSLSTS